MPHLGDVASWTMLTFECAKMWWDLFLLLAATVSQINSACVCRGDQVTCKGTDNIGLVPCLSNYNEAKKLRIMKHTGVITLSKDMLSKFSNLEELDVSFNPNLVQVTKTAFDGLGKLKKLRISHNSNLLSIPPNCLEELYELKVLILAQNGFEDYTTNSFRYCVQVNYQGEYHVRPLGFRFTEAILTPQEPSIDSVDYCIDKRMQLLFVEHKGHPGCEITEAVIDCTSEKIADPTNNGTSYHYPSGKDEECHFYFNLLTHSYTSYLSSTNTYAITQKNIVESLFRLSKTVYNYVIYFEFTQSWSEIKKQVDGLPLEGDATWDDLKDFMERNLGTELIPEIANTTVTTALTTTTRATTTTTNIGTSTTTLNIAANSATTAATAFVSATTASNTTNMTSISSEISSFQGMFLLA